VESTTQDDLHNVKRRKRHIPNNTSQTAKKSIKPAPTSAAVKVPPKAVLTRHFFEEQAAPRKPGRPPSVMTSTINLTRLQSDLKDHVEGE
jgi:hypothetical protein